MKITSSTKSSMNYYCFTEFYPYLSSPAILTASCVSSISGSYSVRKDIKHLLNICLICNKETYSGYFTLEHLLLRTSPSTSSSTSSSNKTTDSSSSSNSSNTSNKDAPVSIVVKSSSPRLLCDVCSNGYKKRYKIPPKAENEIKSVYECYAEYCLDSYPSPAFSMPVPRKPSEGMQKLTSPEDLKMSVSTPSQLFSINKMKNRKNDTSSNLGITSASSVSKDNTQSPNSTRAENSREIKEKNFSEVFENYKKNHTPPSETTPKKPSSSPSSPSQSPSSPSAEIVSSKTKTKCSKNKELPEDFIEDNSSQYLNSFIFRDSFQSDDSEMEKDFEKFDCDSFSEFLSVSNVKSFRSLSSLKAQEGKKVLKKEEKPFLVVVSTVKTSPAEIAGLEVGDGILRIAEIDRNNFKGLDDLKEFFEKNGEKPVKIRFVTREGNVRNSFLVPMGKDLSDKKVWAIGMVVNIIK